MSLWLHYLLSLEFFIVAICPVVSPVYEPWLSEPAFLLLFPLLLLLLFFIAI